jgi:hypothetical protein
MSQFTSLLKWFGKLILVGIGVFIVMIIIIAVVKNKEKNILLHHYHTAFDKINVDSVRATLPSEYERTQAVQVDKSNHVFVNSEAILHYPSFDVSITWSVLLIHSPENKKEYTDVLEFIKEADTLRTP